MIAWEIIREMAHKIVERFQPEKIILFGSYARGEAQESSDVDFLVIANTLLTKPKRSVPLYRLLREYPCSKDILVYTPEEIRQYQDLPTTLIHRALKEGVVLHER